MTGIRVLGICGIASAACSTLSGFTNTPWLLGVAGAIMLLGNVCAIVMKGYVR